MHGQRDRISDSTLVTGCGTALGQGSVCDKTVTAKFSQEGDAPGGGNETGSSADGQGLVAEVEQVTMVPTRADGDYDMATGAQQGTALRHERPHMDARPAAHLSVIPAVVLRAAVVIVGSQSGQDHVDSACHARQLRGGLFRCAVEHHVVGESALVLGRADIGTGDGPPPLLLSESDRVPTRPERFDQNGSRAAVRVQHGVTRSCVEGYGVTCNGRRNTERVPRGAGQVAARSQLRWATELSSGPDRRC
nr:hypothetical protein [Streptomyces sp. GMY02]